MALHTMPPASQIASENDREFRRLLTLARLPGRRGGTIAFPEGVYILSDVFSVPATTALWFAQGARLVIRGKLDIKGPVFAGPHQIFDVKQNAQNVSTSNVRLRLHNGRQSMAELLPEWWGAGNDAGQGIPAMARSIKGAGRYTLIFDHSEVYPARNTLFEPGHSFVSHTGASIQSADGGRPLFEVRYEGLATATRTTFRGLRFVGVPNHPIKIPSNNHLLFLNSALSGRMPTSVIDCAFNDTRAVGLAITPGVMLQGDNLKASDCFRAGLATLSPPTLLDLGLQPRTFSRVIDIGGAQSVLPTHDTFVQLLGDLNGLFNAAITLGSPGLTTHTQMTGMTIGGRLQLLGNAQSQAILLSCGVGGALEVELAQGMLIAVDCAFSDRATRLSQRCGSILKNTSAAALFDNCLFSIDAAVLSPANTLRPRVVAEPTTRSPLIPGSTTSSLIANLDRQEGAINVPCAALHVDWSNQKGLIHMSGPRFAGSGAASDSTSALALRGGLTPKQARIVLSKPLTGGLGLGVVAQGGAAVIILEPVRLPSRSFVANDPREPVELIVQSSDLRQFGGVELMGNIDKTLLSFRDVQGPSIEESRLIGVDAQPVIFGGRDISLRLSDALALEDSITMLAGLEGDVILIQGRLFLVCTQSSGRDAVWHRLLQ